jgi:lipoprotein-releasing system permease protein
VTLYFVQQPPRFRRVAVVGIFETYLENFDEQMVLGELQTIRNLNGWTSDQVGGLELHVADTEQLDVYAPLLEDELDYDLRLLDSRERFLDIFDWLKLLDTNVIVFISLIGFVAIFNMGAILFLLIMERTQMIGLLKAVGAADGQVQKIFWQQGLIVAGFGILLGNMLGLGLCFLQQQTGFIRLDEVAYYVAQAPVKIIWWQVLLVNVFTFVVCFLVLLIPSLLVRRMKPVTALRFD